MFSFGAVRFELTRFLPSKRSREPNTRLLRMRILYKNLVGVAGFEPAKSSRPPDERSARLSYTPKNKKKGPN